MNFFLQPLTLLTFLPLLGVLVLFFIPSDRKSALRWTALGTSLIVFALSLWVLGMFNAAETDSAGTLHLVAQYGTGIGSFVYVHYSFRIVLKFLFFQDSLTVESRQVGRFTGIISADGQNLKYSRMRPPVRRR